MYKKYTVLCNLLVICRILVQSIDEIEDVNAIVNFGIMYYVTSNSIGRLNCSMKIGKEVGNWKNTKTHKKNPIINYCTRMDQ